MRFKFRILHIGILNYAENKSSAKMIIRCLCYSSQNLQYVFGLPDVSQPQSPCDTLHLTCLYILKDTNRGCNLSNRIAQPLENHLPVNS